MIAIRDLRVVKASKTICSVPQLAVAPGERVAIVGANGSGKTTLLRVLAGLEPRFDGACAVRAPPRERVYVHQAPYMFRGTALFNAAYGLRASGMGARESQRHAQNWLDRLGVGELAQMRAARLSGGERRRVALARAMALRPQLLLLDEPLADMDESGAQAVADALTELHGSTILIASPTAVPENLAQRRCQLNGV